MVYGDSVTIYEAVGMGLWAAGICFNLQIKSVIHFLKIHQKQFIICG